MGMTVTLVKEALVAHNFLQDNDEKVQSAPAQVQQRFLGVPDKDIQFSATGAVKGHKVLKQVDSTGDSDDNRAWTLSDVMKLVQGVSRYGLEGGLRSNGLHLHPIRIAPPLTSRINGGIY
ncbi:hypothetical protein GH714_019084 [Hevea brasiliensis]|uniref:Uncharacterized protein n=1 Tax=Hevea brasiliensis TaxID=3981 RepID=A0A6A6LKD4_HEVBR|nr:hypothetical protein GH714_019084 [Hevea brasiliensis]